MDFYTDDNYAKRACNGLRPDSDIDTSLAEDLVDAHVNRSGRMQGAEIVVGYLEDLRSGNCFKSKFSMHCQPGY
jgi:hypothetical protein